MVMTKNITSPVKINPLKVKLYRGLVICFLLLVTSGALSIPFIYESMTLWYKIGIDKIMLLGGQMAGLLAVILVFVQILLATKAAFLRELFGIAALMRWHRMNGIIILLLAFCHVLLVLAPEGMANLPIGIKYWPEMVGGVLFFIIFSMVVSSQFRQKLGLDYKKWRIIHKPLGYLVIIFMVVHVSSVSDTFEQLVPRVALFTTFAGVVVSVFLSKKTSGQRKL